MPPLFFLTPADFHAWLSGNHAEAPELWVGYYKVGSGQPSMTWPESVEAALCFGWIDGLRKSIDKDAYCIRFTPRKPGSIWSAVNIQKVEELMALGLMHARGTAAYERRKDHKSRVYSFEQETVSFDGAAEKAFMAHEAAWEFFGRQPASYKKAAIWWVVSAKQEKTRRSRLETLVADSAAGQHVQHLRRIKPTSRS